MTSSRRLLSLDAFRGATIAAMIMVNNQGGDEAYDQLQHAAWHGWTFTDLIFPFFLFIMGVAMTFSFAHRAEEEKLKLYSHIIKRSFIIFALGLFVNAFPFGLFGSSFSLETWRIPGVLQRIAVCYLIASFILLHTTLRGQIVWVVGLLTGYWLLVKLVPVPGYGAGVLEPMGSLEWWIDSQVFGGHTWEFAPVQGIDPEGLLGTITALGTTLFGVIAGWLLRSRKSDEAKTIWMVGVGLGLLLLGQIFNSWLPINKNLWTTSYAIFMAGWANLCLGIFYFIIDVKEHSQWSKPFIIFGINAIVVYVFAECFASFLWSIVWTKPDGEITTLHDWIYERLFLPWFGSMNASLFFSFTVVFLCYALAWFLWRRKIILRV